MGVWGWCCSNFGVHFGGSKNVKRVGTMRVRQQIKFFFQFLLSHPTQDTNEVTLLTEGLNVSNFYVFYFSYCDRAKFEHHAPNKLAPFGIYKFFANQVKQFAFRNLTIAPWILK